MAFKNGCYATLWNMEKDKEGVINMYDKYAEINITTGRKNKDGKYTTDFSGRVRCLGSAYETISQLELKEKDRVRLLEVECTNKHDKEKGKTYTNFTCWSLELVEKKKATPKQPEIVGEAPVFDAIDPDDLPF